MVRVSVVVPFRNERQHLQRCVDALRRQDDPGSGYELILVDNGSTDGSADVAGRFPEATVLAEPAPGPYAARNRGAAHARGSILAFTDADCAVAPGWIRAVVAAFRDEHVDLVLGARQPRGRSRAVRLLAEYEQARNEYVFSGRDPELYFGYTNAMAVRREAFLEAGGFAEGRRGGDSVLVQRVVRARSCEAVRLEPAMEVTHLELGSVRDQLRKHFVYGRSTRLFASLERVRPLSRRERRLVLRRSVTANRRSRCDALLLVLLLLAGSACWHAGALSARLVPAE